MASNISRNVKVETFHVDKMFVNCISRSRHFSPLSLCASNVLNELAMLTWSQNVQNIWKQWMENIIKVQSNGKINRIEEVEERTHKKLTQRLSTQVLIKVITVSICKFMCLHKRKMCFDVYQRNFFPSTMFSSVIKWDYKVENTSNFAYFIHFT